jgi:hypothetical protein
MRRQWNPKTFKRLLVYFLLSNVLGLQVRTRVLCTHQRREANTSTATFKLAFAAASAANRVTPLIAFCIPESHRKSRKRLSKRLESIPYESRNDLSSRVPSGISISPDKSLVAIFTTVSAHDALILVLRREETVWSDEASKLIKVKGLMAAERITGSSLYRPSRILLIVVTQKLKPTLIISDSLLRFTRISAFLLGCVSSIDCQARQAL